MGIKGKQCQAVTEKLNVGEVYSTEPTDEMFEEEVTVADKVYETNQSEW